MDIDIAVPEIPRPFKIFLNKCLNKDPLKRATVDQLLESDEFVGAYILSLQWKIERIVWIGYYKNENNFQCFWKLVPKDLVNHILSFLNTKNSKYF